MSRPTLYPEATRLPPPLSSRHPARPRLSHWRAPAVRPGVYHLEVNGVSGFPLFSDYLYCGVPYLSPPPRAVYPADARSLSPAEHAARQLWLPALYP